MVCNIKRCQTVKEIMEELPIKNYSPEMTYISVKLIFNYPVLTALKYLRGNSGLDKKCLNILKDPIMYSLVEVALEWINDNYDNIPREIDLDFLTVPEDDIIEDNLLYDDWEPEYVDF